jgi:hypothetical protein
VEVFEDCVLLSIVRGYQRIERVVGVVLAKRRRVENGSTLGVEIGRRDMEMKYEDEERAVILIVVILLE